MTIKTRKFLKKIDIKGKIYAQKWIVAVDTDNYGALLDGKSIGQMKICDFRGNPTDAKIDEIGFALQRMENEIWRDTMLKAVRAAFRAGESKFQAKEQMGEFYGDEWRPLEKKI